MYGIIWETVCWLFAPLKSRLFILKRKLFVVMMIYLDSGFTWIDSAVVGILAMKLILLSLIYSMVNSGPLFRTVHWARSATTAVTTLTTPRSRPWRAFCGTSRGPGPAPPRQRPRQTCSAPALRRRPNVWVKKTEGAPESQPPNLVGDLLGLRVATQIDPHY